MRPGIRPMLTMPADRPTRRCIFNLHRARLECFGSRRCLRSSVLSLISSVPAKNELYPIMHLQHNSLRVVRQYVEISQPCKMETTKIVSSRQQLTMTGVARAEEIEDDLAAPRRPPPKHSIEFGRCTHRTLKIGNIGACWNIGESASASHRCRCCKK